jgi:hypothetical protein
MREKQQQEKTRPKGDKFNLKSSVLLNNNKKISLMELSNFWK